jgi:hypothetical protein
MAHTSVDTWTVVLPAQQQRSLEFKALINDKTWALGANGWADTAETSIEYFPWFKKTTGRYEYLRQVPSPQFGNTRDVVVYVPPSYDENTLKIYSELLVGAFGVSKCSDT